MNPYEAPSARVGDQLASDPGLEGLAKGQKLIIYAVLAYIASAAVQSFVAPLAGLAVLLLATLLAVVGLIKVSRGLQHPALLTTLIVALTFVPIINWITLLIVNGRATRVLRKGGYKVGLLGASRLGSSVA